MRNAHRWVMAARVTEGLLLAVAVWLAVLSVAVLARQPLAFDGAQTAALTAGLSAGIAYVMAERVPIQALVRTLDGRLGKAGELATAWEQAALPERSALSRLLAERVSRALPRRQVMHTCSPNSLPFLALPLLACAAFALAREQVAQGEQAWRRSLAERVAEELKRARALAMEAQAEGSLDLEQLQQLFTTEEGARELAASLRRGGEQARGAPERALESMRELGEQVADLSAGLDPSSELARALERAREVAETAEIGLERQALAAHSGESRAPAEVGEQAGGISESESSMDGKPSGADPSGTDPAPSELTASGEESGTGAHSVGTMESSEPSTAVTNDDPMKQERKRESDAGAQAGPNAPANPSGPTRTHHLRREDAALVEAWVRGRRASGNSGRPSAGGEGDD